MGRQTRPGISSFSGMTGASSSFFQRIYHLYAKNLASRSLFSLHQFFNHSYHRKAEEEFKLCEVIVFGAGGGELAEGKEECGDPELGMGAVLDGPSRSHERKVVCSEGLELEGGGSSATIRCQDGRWNSSSVHCRPPSCQTPPSVKGAKVEVVGSRAIYSCSLPGRFDKPQFKLGTSGNKSC